MLDFLEALAGLEGVGDVTFQAICEGLSTEVDQWGTITLCVEFPKGQFRQQVRAFGKSNLLPVWK